MTTRSHLIEMDSSSSSHSEGLSRRFHLIALEDAIDAGAQLTFTQKALNTLENLFDLWMRDGALPSIPYGYIHEGQWRFHEKPDAKEDGMAYACSERLAPIVYSWLQGKGYLETVNIPGMQQLVLSPSAFVEAEKIKSGREATLKRGFFIRRFDEATDAFYRPILNDLQQTTGCEISAVWERKKNEKLDELILRRIREASVIVLDVTGERFNVGLEAGYAMALRKQIILLRDGGDPLLPIKPDSEEKHHDVPFDIRTLNCFFYDRHKPEELQAMLKERVLDALEEARLGTH